MDVHAAPVKFGGQRVHAGDVVGELAAGHARRQRVLVEHVAADDARAAGGKRALCRVG